MGAVNGGMMLPFLSVAAHHGEAADPDLMEWIMHRVDSLVGLGPVAAVIVLAGVIVLIPVGVLGLYALYRRKTEPTGDES